jgi:hypothetical protein
MTDNPRPTAHTTLIEALDGQIEWKAGGHGGGGTWHVTYRNLCAKFPFVRNGECELHTLYIAKDPATTNSTDHHDYTERLRPDAYWVFHKLMLKHGEPITSSASA